MKLPNVVDYQGHIMPLYN